MIPKIIHQTWKTHKLPRNYAAWVETWKRYNPEWEHRIWTDEDNRDFIATEYPWFLPIYDGYENGQLVEGHDLAHIKKADAVRPFYLYHYGGLYVDMDFECLKPFDDVRDGYEVGFGQLGDDLNNNRAIPNALMMSVKGSPFWEETFNKMESEKDVKFVTDATGPGMIYHCVKETERDVKIFPPEQFYPVDWGKGSEIIRAEDGDNIRDKVLIKTELPDHEEVKKLLPNSHAVTYWTTSWFGWTKETQERWSK